MEGKCHSENTVELVIDALLIDGAHHKQWYLERILESLGVDLEQTREIFENEGYEWEPGIPP